MSASVLKWNLLFVTSMFALNPLSVYAQVIYGLENATHLKQGTKPFFIQVGSFHSEQSAKQLKAQWAKQTHYPVQILFSRGFYSVRIGPLPSVNAVRSLTAKEIPTQKSFRKSRAIVKKHLISQNTGTVKRYIQPHSSNPQPTLITNSTQSRYLSIGAGLMETNGNNKILTVHNGSDFPPPENLDQYSTSRHQPALLDIQAGKRWSRDEQWLPAYSLALRYEHLFVKDIHGMVTQYSIPEFLNYSYNWGIGADAISLYSKLGLVEYRRFMPYVDLGLGLSSNYSAFYTERALPNVTARYSPHYDSLRSTHLTYNVGAGLDFQLNNNVLVSIGYDFQSFGDLFSGYGQGPNWGTERLNFGKLNANMGTIGVSYLFDNSVPNMGFK